MGVNREAVLRIKSGLTWACWDGEHRLCKSGDRCRCYCHVATHHPAGRAALREREK